MKQFIAITVAMAMSLVYSVCATAQSAHLTNILKLRNGSEIKCRVLESTADEVKVSTADGSVFVYPTSEVVSLSANEETGNALPKLMRIGMRNKFQCGDQVLRMRHLRKYFADNCAEASVLWEKQRRLRTAAVVAFFVITPLGSLAFSIPANVIVERAIETYNNQCAASNQ